MEPCGANLQTGPSKISTLHMKALVGSHGISEMIALTVGHAILCLPVILVSKAGKSHQQDRCLHKPFI